MKKKKMLVFHSALAPYRIDQFNLLGDIFDLEIVFYLNNVPTFKFNQSYLKNLCNFKISFLLIGPGKRNRFFRFGVFRKIKKVKPDYILSYEYSPTTHYLLMLKRLGLLKQKIGTMVDDSIDMCISPQTKARKLSRNLIVKKLDFIVLLSQQVAQFYHLHFNIDKNKIIISPLLQLEERLRSNFDILQQKASEYISKYELQNKKVLLYVGRFTAVKGLIQFLENITEIISNYDDLKIIFIGDGNEIENITTFIKDNNFEDKIILPGRFENIELYPWFLSASGFFLPSTFEPFGAVVNESLIFGSKVLCSRFAGASTLISQHNGIVFDPLDKTDTLHKTKEFLSEIKRIGEVNLNEKKSLMNSHLHDYRREWEKIQF